VARHRSLARQGVTVSLGIQGSGQWVEGLPDPGLLRAVAELAESLGYDSIWAGDHVSFHNPIVGIDVALSVFATVTKRIAIGSGIVLLPLRHPSLVAKTFASLDWLSGGRVVLGVGVGGEGPKDFEAVGVPASERGARTNEALRALRELFRGGPASFSGRFFAFEGVEIEPQAVQPGGPPLWVGGRSEAALRRAGSLGDGWMPIWVSAEKFAAGLREMRSWGREVTAAVVLPALVDDDGERARRLLAEHLSRRYRFEVEPHLVARYCCAGTPDECAAVVRTYADAGAEHVVFNPGCGPEDFLSQVERLRAVAA
jgi:probable F420-dependent oxidoreductase